MDQNTIIFSNVSARLPGLSELALDNISFSIFKGELVGFYFDEEVSKKIFLQIISNMIKLNSGTVFVSDSVRIVSRETIKCLPPGFSIEDSVYFYGSMAGLRKREIKEKFSEIIELSGLGAYLKEKFGVLPNKYKCSLVVAISCFLPEKILGFDELLLPKDRIFLDKALNKLKEMNKEGKTTLVVSCTPWSLKHLEKNFSIKGGKLYREEKSQIKDLALASVD